MYICPTAYVHVETQYANSTCVYHACTKVMFLFYRPLATAVEPVFEEPPKKYFAERIIRILMDPKVDPNKICKQRPLAVNQSATFIVDLNSLQDPEHVKRDNFGM